MPTLIIKDGRKDLKISTMYDINQVFESERRRLLGEQVKRGIRRAKETGRLSYRAAKPLFKFAATEREFYLSNDPILFAFTEKHVQDMATQFAGRKLNDLELKSFVDSITLDTDIVCNIWELIKQYIEDVVGLGLNPESADLEETIGAFLSDGKLYKRKAQDGHEQGSK